MRGSIGVSLGQGPPSYEPVKSFPKDDSKTCKAMVFSPEGSYFAWVNGMSAKILHCDTWKVAIEIKRPKISAIQFSTRGTYFMTWEPFIGTKLHIMLFTSINYIILLIIYVYFLSFYLLSYFLQNLYSKINNYNYIIPKSFFILILFTLLLTFLL